MAKITLSIHDLALKEQIKEYAKQRGLSVSTIVENFLKKLIITAKKDERKDYGLPDELDSLLDGIEISNEVKDISYKTLRDDMYVIRAQIWLQSYREL